jgi:GntR family transcriptional repressor for pyruvate dehydrogenase complex
MIATGELETGQLLPSEAELCERFAVSRSSLREAQKMLAVAGVLSPHPGSTSAVSGMSAKEIMSGLDMIIPLLPLDRYLELFSLREVLEGHLAALSAARLSDEDCRRLVKAAEDLAVTPPSDKAQLLDTEYHQIIIWGAGEDLIAGLLETIRRRGRDYRTFETDNREELKAISDQAHRDIAAAISARDPEAARFISMQHVRTTRTWLAGIRPGPVQLDGD